MIFLRREVLARRTTILVLDGMAAIEAKAEFKSGLKPLAYGLQVLASSTNCTMFLLTTASGATTPPEATMVDGLIELRQREYGLRLERRAVVHKLRGSQYLEGEHAFSITREGVTFFPRVEAAFAKHASRVAPSGTRLSFGVPSLDAVFGGGLPVATVAAAVGVSGAGKTTLGLHFLSGSSAEQPGLFFGCYEPPERLRFRATTIGIDLAGAEQRGDIEFLWFPVGDTFWMNLPTSCSRRLAARRQAFGHRWLSCLSGGSARAGADHTLLVCSLERTASARRHDAAHLGTAGTFRPRGAYAVARYRFSE